MAEQWGTGFLCMELWAETTMFSLPPLWLKEVFVFSTTRLSHLTSLRTAMCFLALHFWPIWAHLNCCSLSVAWNMIILYQITAQMSCMDVKQLYCDSMYNWMQPVKYRLGAPHHFWNKASKAVRRTLSNIYHWFKTLQPRPSLKLSVVSNAGFMQYGISTIIARPDRRRESGTKMGIGCDNWWVYPV